MNEAVKGRVVVLGARSEIGLAIARAFAAQGHPISLAARRAPELEPERADIALRHNVDVELLEFDVLETEALGPFVQDAPGLPSVVVSVIGAMGDQRDSETDVAAAAQVFRTNFEGPAQVLGLYAERMISEGAGGTLVGVSSVAGDRGRGSNYVYGSAKAGFTAFLSGLRNRLAGQGVHVVTVKPGFVDTQMTRGMDLPKALTAAPEEVGAAVLRAVEKQRNVIYVRPVWWLVMGIICALPEGIFKRTKL
ncbi:SDR family oxidoreductase [Alloyangia pacifica]|uniref:SDR family oxidoreductase n=1 Tax=Alloyangia pacifica TaxID=311180 RepID=UPI001CD7CBA9|nr:SDR family oxidoreductase [Alloyangia pacifica]MCA0997306.1 SDR family oxidoreductase [Alloyangia pacifica]